MVSVHHPAWSRASISGVGYVKASCLPATSACISSRVDGVLPMLDCGQSQQIPDGSTAALQRQRGWRRGTCSAQRLPWVGSTPVACGRSFKGQRDLVGHWAAGIMTHLCEALPRRGLTMYYIAVQTQDIIGRSDSECRSQHPHKQCWATSIGPAGLTRNSQFASTLLQ